MRWSRTFIHTLRQDPSDAEVVSHRLMTRAGLEIGVASTKAFTTQLVALQLLVVKLAVLGGRAGEDDVAGWVADFERLPGQGRQALEVGRPVVEAQGMPGQQMVTGHELVIRVGELFEKSPFPQEDLRREVRHGDEGRDHALDLDLRTVQQDIPAGHREHATRRRGELCSAS